MRTSLITGANGQDGSFLCELLLSKNYEVYGMVRRTSLPNTAHISHFLDKPNFHLVCCDITDASGIFRIVKDIQPNEIYNLAATSHVGQSFIDPITTTNVVYGGCLNILEAVRQCSPHSRFYQASSSEMFGAGSTYQDEQTPLSPLSPYAIAKTAAHHLVNVYRQAYSLHCSAGILFNHESDRRGADFVTKKIADYVSRLPLNFDPKKLQLGNITAKRDWGYAPDYVRAMWMILQQDIPDDYVIATGETHSVEEFLEEAFSLLGYKWKEYVDINTKGEVRPTDVPYLCGNANKAKTMLGWEPTVRFKQLLKIMVTGDERTL